MAVTENRVAGLQERLKEVMRCEQLNKQQFMKVTDIKNIGRKLDGKVAITRVDISKMKHSLMVNDQWFETGTGPMYLPEKLEEKTRELNRMSGSYPHLHIADDLIKEEIERAAQHAKDCSNPSTSVIASMFGHHNNQNIETGTERAKEREEQSLIDKNAQLIQIINAQNETIRSKDSEIRLLRKILADNGIEV
nr:MAG TPA: voltage-gated hydrogen channel protein [Caudoviricetes sp.]